MPPGAILSLADLLADPSRATAADARRLLPEATALASSLLVKAMEPPAPQVAEDRLLSVPEAAVKLAVKPTHLYELIRRDRFPAVEVGKYVRVRSADVEEAQRKGLAGLVPARPKRGLDKGQTIRLP